MLAVVLRDRRIAFNETRYCDLAIGVMEKAANQRFGSGGKTVNERDAAVSRALAWLQIHGVSH